MPMRRTPRAAGSHSVLSAGWLPILHSWTSRSLLVLLFAGGREGFRWTGVYLNRWEAAARRENEGILMLLHLLTLPLRQTKQSRNMGLDQLLRPRRSRAALLLLHPPLHQSRQHSLLLSCRTRYR